MVPSISGSRLKMIQQGEEHIREGGEDKQSNRYDLADKDEEGKEGKKRNDNIFKDTTKRYGRV